MANTWIKEILDKNGVCSLDLVNHAFLPKRLPQTEDRNLVGIEQALLEIIANLFCKDWSRIVQLKNATRLFTRWPILQKMPTGLQAELKSLDNGNSVCIYVRMQNCAIIFTKLNDSYVRVVTFRGSLPNQQVMQVCGSLRVNYPETVSIVPVSPLLLSNCFSSQLGSLCETVCDIAMPTSTKGRQQSFQETREPPNPYMISEFLVGLLCPIDPDKFAQVDEGIKIEKKVRDQVNWSNAAVPFRRSGMYHIVKVTLQMSLQEELGNKSDALVLYKTIMLRFLADLAQQYRRDLQKTWDTSAQIMIKLARRARKLSKLETSTNASLESYKRSMIDYVASVVQKIHDETNEEWNLTAFPVNDGEQEIYPILRSDEEWLQDSVHVMSNLHSYLKSDRKVSISNSGNLGRDLRLIDQVERDTTLRRLVERSKNISNTQQDVHLNTLHVWIHQVEHFIRTIPTESQCCQDIFNLMQEYTKHVVNLYAENYSDPICFSRMIATVLKFVETLDKIAVTEHPLLAQYATGISSKMFTNLLIPEKCDMEMLKSTMEYFEERNRRARFPSWIQSSQIDTASFSVRFAEKNMKMRVLKAQILSDTEKEINTKLQKIAKVKLECENLQIMIDSSECTYIWDDFLEFSKHSNTCYRCIFKQQLEAKRYSVGCYQRPLPEDDHLRNAVVFELCIPQEIAHLRDAVVTFLTDILGIETLAPVVSSIHTRWTTFDELKRYTKTGFQTSTHLGSTAKSTLSSHYGRKNPDVLSSHSKFILDNGLNCRLYHERELSFRPQQGLCTFQISKMSPKDSPSYKALQFALNEDRATENDVISRQYECHQQLTLRQFITFGSVRCSHKIQIRNLYQAMACQVFSLDKEPVLGLIMQTLYELGPGNEIHVDLGSPEYEGFALEFLNLLQKICNDNAKNWSNPLILLSLTVVALRVLELSQSSTVKIAAAELLHKQREITENWCTTLEDLLAKAENNAVHTVLLQELLLKTALCSVYTFNVSEETLLPYVLNNGEDLPYFLNSLSRLHHLVIRENILQASKLSVFLKNLVRHARTTIPLNLEEYIRKILARSSSPLHQFVCLKWSAAAGYKNCPKFYDQTNYCPLKQHAYLGEYNNGRENHLVCVDILRGTFFVDGYPPSVLPESITRSPLYKSFFGTSKFRVQRDLTTFTTVDKYCGNHYEFTENADKSLIIRQLREDSQYFELLPKIKFENLIPADIINLYTQWFDSRTKNIHFCEKPKEDGKFDVENLSAYILKPVHGNILGQSWFLEKLASLQESHYLLSIKSIGFQQITQNLSKLDVHSCIHVTLNISGNRDINISAKLWRLNLSFALIKEKGLLGCENYQEFYLPTSQSGLGTLVGMQFGAVLCKQTPAEPSGIKKMFLAPHRPLLYAKMPDANHFHQTVHFGEDQLRNPPYFVFEVDQVLKRLCPGNDKSAWLYLALLHALTSSPFMDPFTELTGTEMAMWILQSGFVWSCSPYDFECKTTLHAISALSPEVTYYPQHLENMQKTVWPKGFDKNSYAAFEGYYMLVEKLINDSVKLEGLFPKQQQNEEWKRKNEWKKPDTSLKLLKRSYFRHVNLYNSAAHLNKNFLEDPAESCFVRELASSLLNSANFAQLASIRHQQKFFRSPFIKSSTISSLLITQEPLPVNSADNFSKKSVKDWLQLNFRDNWLSLYSIVKNSQKHGLQHEVTFILASILYAGNGSWEQLAHLHNISVSSANDYPTAVKSITSADNFSPLDNTFVHADISAIVRRRAEPPPRKADHKTKTQFNAAKREYERKLDSQVTVTTQEISKYWPIESVHLELLAFAWGDALCLRDADNQTCYSINSLLAKWYNNRNLMLFVDKVQSILNQIEAISPYNYLSFTPSANFLKFCTSTDATDKWMPTLNLKAANKCILAAQEILETGRTNFCNIQSNISENREQCLDMIKGFQLEIQRIVTRDQIHKMVKNSGIHIRLSPVTILRECISETRSSHVNTLLKAVAVLWCHLKRFNRIILYHSNRKYSFELSRAKKNGECDNWQPGQNFEWVLIELELDITIRPTQVQVARHMMQMPDAGNGVMQLNMGEGKTSVIVPMIVSTLTLGKSRQQMLCRVTVLNSIFATNFNLLSFAIGGFLNKRVYTVPCSRDLEINKYLSKIEESYNECRKLGGVVITLPEYRLSFRLQIYNKFLREEHQTAMAIYKIEAMLRKFARDIVDESDEIFSVKYQLIYTTGLQEQIDGKRLRWTVAQKLLEFVPAVATTLYEKYGADVIEYQPKVQTENPEKFTHFRILEDKCKQDFYNLVADGILDGKVDLLGQILTEEERVLVKEFLVNEDISEADHRKVALECGLPKEKIPVLLIASGYLRRGILLASLKKRWRVEYGVQEVKPGIKSCKMMAVPFRAKDVAAERTEFGHPDMAIVLTLLSYYYSGLKDEQLLECFRLLETVISAPEGVYNSWIKKIPKEKITSDSIRSYKGINLQDFEQRVNHLFPVLRKNKAVVDFWLENIAFPRECRQFPGKLISNAWDLCYQNSTQRTTGFSGTNDTSLLLPLPITQQDLDFLKQTNAEMEETLQRTENRYERYLEMGATCQKVLQYLIQDDLRVLIDSGALMLELDNEAIAKLWLILDSKLEAVVYFGKNNNLLVKAKGQQKYQKDQPLSLSSFRDNMANCAVYLDDQHTRGTDIRLPTNFKACVTVGSGMRRDKLIQACMRMRKLGKGQSVHFYLSHEVRNKILLQKKGDALLSENISVGDILKWAKQNSRQYEEDGLVYWATSARNYANKLVADDVFELSPKTNLDGEWLGKRCEDPDLQTLQVMYGTYHHRVPLTQLVYRWFNQILKKLDLQDGQVRDKVMQTLQEIAIKVKEKCRQHIPNRALFSSMLDEEQEKELEPEQEDQVQKQMPSREMPENAKLHENVDRCVRLGRKLEVLDGISSLSKIFEETSVRNELQAKFWGNQCYVTDDFVRVVTGWNRKTSIIPSCTDKFLRPITYFVSFEESNGSTKILVLSRYEVDCLLDSLRDESRKCKRTLHMFTGRWMEGQNILANKRGLQVPIRETVKLSENLLSPLLIAAGNLFFQTMEEQKAFAGFLGLRPRPWTKEDHDAFGMRMISCTGFVSPCCPQLRQNSEFVDDPTGMVRSILKIRNEVLRDTDQMLCMLDKCAYLSLKQTEEEEDVNNISGLLKDALKF